MSAFTKSPAKSSMPASADIAPMAETEGGKTKGEKSEGTRTSWGPARLFPEKQYKEHYPNYPQPDRHHEVSLKFCIMDAIRKAGGSLKISGVYDYMEANFNRERWTRGKHQFQIDDAVTWKQSVRKATSVNRVSSGHFVQFDNVMGLSGSNADDLFYQETKGKGMPWKINPKVDVDATLNGLLRGAGYDGWLKDRQNELQSIDELMDARFRPDPSGSSSARTKRQSKKKRPSENAKEVAPRQKRRRTNSSTSSGTMRSTQSVSPSNNEATQHPIEREASQQSSQTEASQPPSPTEASPHPSPMERCDMSHPRRLLVSTPQLPCILPRIPELDEPLPLRFQAGHLPSPTAPSDIQRCLLGISSIGPTSQNETRIRSSFCRTHPYPLRILPLPVPSSPIYLQRPGTPPPGSPVLRANA